MTTTRTENLNESSSGSSATETQQNNQQNQNIKKNYLLYRFYSNVIQMWENLKKIYDNILSRTGAYVYLDDLAKFSAKHPYLAAVVTLIIVAVASPFLIMAIFAMLIVLITFTGFILVEGTLITIASILLFGCLGACLIVFIFFGFSGIAAYIGFMYTYDLWNDLNQKAALKSFLRKESRTKTVITSNGN